MKKNKLMMITNVTFFLFFLFLAWAVHSQETGKIVPKLLFEKSATGENALTAARNFTLDKDQNIYIFDYLSNHIYKYDQQGRQISVFGKQGKGEKDFKHLTAIKVKDNKLLALDSVAWFVFNLKGNFISKQPFAREVICELPKILGKDYFMGEQIVSEELKKVLTLRNQKGEEVQRLNTYNLKDYFPDLEKGKEFFINDTYARGFLYDCFENGSLIWAASDKYCLYKVQHNQSIPWIIGRGKPVPFPLDQQEKMAAKHKAVRKNMPSLHMYVPKVYPIIQKLFVGEKDVWTYLMSQERTGFARYSAQGKEIGFYNLVADFDIMKARIQIFNNNLYILVPQRKAFQMYVAPVPVN